jgi:glycosyltransferase involved in cell wall biosynthesis
LLALQLTESFVNGLRILVLAPECNPEGVTNPSIGFHQAQALARIHQVTLVLYASNKDAVLRGGGAFYALEPVRVPLLDRLYDWALARIFKHDYGRQSLTAFSYPRHVLFELRAWWQLRRRIRSGDYDVVLRILPYNRVFPSPFAWLLRNGPIPFVIGPISGGLPWATGFEQLDQQRNEPGYWVWNLRAVSGHVPFATSTYTKAAAVIVGSSHTHAELARYCEKLFFMPTEIGVNPSLFQERRASQNERLELIFVGRLIPLKACDLALRAAAPLLRSGAAHFTVVGDGPQRQKLVELATSLDVEGGVSFAGWLSHSDTLRALERADVLVFPSLRETGGGVVFEALTAGAVPIVAEFGGPGDVVTPDIGFAIPMSSADDMVARMKSVLQKLAVDRHLLETLRQRGMAYARAHLTYDARARILTDVLGWVLGKGPKPSLEPPPSNWARTHTKIAPKSIDGPLTVVR